MKLSDELQLHKLTIDVTEFRNILADQFATNYPEWKTEWLLCRPWQALFYTERVCELLGIKHTDEATEFILRTLLNVRKTGESLVS